MHFKYHSERNDKCTKQGLERKCYGGGDYQSALTFMTDVYD